MTTKPIEDALLSKEGYWKFFTRLIEMARFGATAACIGWLLFWFALVPEFDNITTRMSGALSLISFIAATGAGLMACVVMVRTGNRLGTKGDRVVHLLQTSYALIASLAGIYAHFRWPPTG